MDKLFDFRLQSSKLKLKYILDPKQPGKRKSIPAPIKKIMWETYISKELRIGKCFCCQKTDILETDCHAGHIISDKDGGKIEVDNLRPVCAKCNQSMGSKNMYEFISEYGFWNE